MTQAIEDNGEKFAANPKWEEISEDYRKELIDVRRYEYSKYTKLNYKTSSRHYLQVHLSRLLFRANKYGI